MTIIIDPIMDTIIIKMYLRRTLLAILKHTQATYPDKIDSESMATETLALNTWIDELVLTWTD